MELAELRVFLTVAAERSFSRAASKLHRTQPAVSQAIRRLEEQVGERLFDRSSKDGTLTEAGRVLREYAERLQEQGIGLYYHNHHIEFAKFDGDLDAVLGRGVLLQCASAP